MRDPHVVSLLYRAISAASTAFDHPPPVESETDAFQIRLADGVIKFEVKKHCASEQEARNLVEPYLRAWEIGSALRFGYRIIWFEFKSATVIDRDPSPPTSRLTNIVGSIPHLSDITGTVILSHYPSLPDKLVASPDVETMWSRFESYRAGRESLAAMGYLCLTVLGTSAGGRKKAAKQYRVNLEVLSKLGFLTSEIGDAHTARKVPSNGQFRPHTEAEVLWIEAVVSRLIRRAGEWAYDPNAMRPEIRMVDLPSLWI